MALKNKNRYAQAAILTATSVAIVAAIGAALGPTVFVLIAVTLPAPLVVLWLSADVYRADELGDAEHADRRQATSEPRVETRRAQPTAA